jgi:transcriptional regulator with XRE-family HTH domain
MMRSNISRIEAAKHRPTLETLERIAKALKVSVAELVARR